MPFYSKRKHKSHPITGWLLLVLKANGLYQIRLDDCH